jgi:hypothetical protein
VVITPPALPRPTDDSAAQPATPITFLPPPQLQAQAEAQPQGQFPAFTIPDAQAPAPILSGASSLPDLPPPAAGPATVTPPAPLVVQLPTIVAPATPPPLVLPVARE